MRERVDHARLDALARRAQRGDVGARDQLLARVDRALRQAVTRYNGVDRDDLLQEARIGVIRALSAWKSTGGMHFRTYAVLYARGCCARVVHHQALVRSVMQPLDLEHDSEEGLYENERPEVGDGGAAVTASELRLDHQVLNRALNRLDWTESYAIRRRIAGDTLEQVGAGLRVSKEWVRKNTPRLITKLRKRAHVDGVIARG